MPTAVKTKGKRKPTTEPAKDAVAAGVKAGDLIRKVSAVADGKGGGRPDSAMGGGTNVAKLDEAINSFLPFVKEVIG